MQIENFLFFCTDIIKIHQKKNYICRKTRMLHFLVIEKSDCASTLNLQVLNLVCSYVRTSIQIENIFFQHVLFIFITKLYFIMFWIRIVMKLEVFNVENIYCLMAFICTECWNMNNYWKMEIALKFCLKQLNKRKIS